MPSNDSAEARHGEAVGRVAGLWRYPVKSMAGEALDRADVSWHGVAGDRRWAFVRGDVPHSPFPWLTLRERADLCRYLPSLADPTRPDTSATRVRTPDGAELDVTDAALAEALQPAGSGLTLIRQHRGVFDTMPLSLITTATISRLGELTGRSLEVARFRPNVLVESITAEPFVEDRWVGAVLRIGAVRLRVDQRDQRCVIITIDPQTGERDADILRAVAREREGCLGVYGSTVEPGGMVVGDTVYLERS